MEILSFMASMSIQMIFVFKCSTSPDDPEGIGNEVGMHGDFVKDVVRIIQGYTNGIKFDVPGFGHSATSAEAILFVNFAVLQNRRFGFDPSGITLISFS